ncbi:unnamed protein product, partial [Closterium sp. NIES-53]
GRPIHFDTWLDDLQLYLLNDSRDIVLLFDHTSRASLAPPATTDSATHSQWLTHDAAARLAVRNHLPLDERAHFGQHKTAKALYDAVVARYSSLAIAALGRLILPYLFPELSAFATVEDRVTHLRTSDARYRAALPAELLERNPPPMYITLYFIVTRLPNSLRADRDHFLALDPTDLTVDLLEKHLLAAESSVVAVGAACGTTRTPFFEGCSPSPLAHPTLVLLLLTSLVLRMSGLLLLLVGGAAAARARVAGVVAVAAGVVDGGGSGGGGMAEVVAAHRCISRLDDAWRAEFGDEVERPHKAELLRYGVDIFALDYDAILDAMYALSVSAEGDCYRCVPPDPGIEATALGASESALPGTTPTEALHTLTLDSGASRSFFRDSTTLTPLSARVVVRQADPSGGLVLARSSTVLPCSAIPSGSLSGLHLPSFSTNLVSTAALQDAMVTTTTPGGPVAPPCSCRLLSHQNLLWHHRLGHPSLPRLRGMHSRLLISGLPRSLPPLPPLPAPPCLPCVEGRQCAVPHSSSFPPTTAPLQTLHMDVWGPARVSGQDRERYFLMVVDDYTRYTTVFPLRSKGEVPDVLIPWIREFRLHLCERFRQDLPVLRLHSDRGGEFSSDLLRDFYRGEGILQTFTLPASPQRNGIAEHRIGLVMEVARTSMIHASAPHFLWPFAVRYAAHQLNLWPRVSLSETSHTLRWTGKVGDTSVFRVWGSRAFVRNLFADKLSSRAIPCVFLGFPLDVPSWQFYQPTSRRVLPSQDGTSCSLRCVSGKPTPWDCAYRDLGGAEPEGAELGGAESEGAESGGAEPEGAEPEGAEPGGRVHGGRRLGDRGRRGEDSIHATRLVSASTTPLSPREVPLSVPLRGRPGDPSRGGLRCGSLSRWGSEAWVGGAESEGAESGGAEPGGAEPGGSGATSLGGAGVPPGAGGTRGAGAAGPGGAHTRGTGAAGAAGGAGAGDPGAGGAGAGGIGAGGARAGDTGAGDFGAGDPDAGGAGAGGTGAGGAGAGGTGAGDLGARGVGAGGAGAGGSGARGNVQRRPFFVPPPLSSPPRLDSVLRQVLSLPSSTGLPPCLLGTPPHQLEPQLQPDSPLPAPSPYAEHTDSFIECLEPESRSASPVRTGRHVPRPRPPPVPGTHIMTLPRAASPTVPRLLATVVSDPSFESTAASALVAELVDFSATCRLNHTTSLVAESESDCPPSVGGDCALSTDGDPDAPDLPTPRSYAEAITGPYSSQWQTAMDIEMASWKTTSTYVDTVSPSEANIVDGMWIFRGVDFFHNFSPTSKMTTLWVLLHVPLSVSTSCTLLNSTQLSYRACLQEEIWLRRPPGFTGSFPAGTQWSLQWPVYGLRHAPREWQDTLRTTLANLGFSPSTADPSLFLHTDTSLPPFYVLVYVDDLVFATPNTEALALVKSVLQKRHTCTDVGELRSYLGLQITRDRARRTITLTQSHMVQQVLQHYGFRYSSS